MGPFFGTGPQGQQIWCETRVDGHSPDERDRETRDVLHNPRESVVVRIGIGRKASFYSQ